MRIDVLASHGEIFGIVAIVDLGRTRSVGSPPEVEDQLFRAAN